MYALPLKSCFLFVQPILTTTLLCSFPCRFVALYCPLVSSFPGHRTFLAMPYAYKMFSEHLLLCGLMLVGIVLNLSRNLKVHGVWCAVCMYLQLCTDIKF